MGICELTTEEKKMNEFRAIGIAFMGVQSVQEPRGIFVLAQPGAGKTGLISFIKLEFKNRYGQSILHVDPDEIGKLHPHYDEIMQEHIQQSYVILQEFIKPVMRTINDMAFERRVNMLTEGTFRAKAEYIANILQMREMGYYIDLNFMAVDSMESMLSAIERYYYEKEQGLIPRNVKTMWHDLAYTGMLETLQEVENRGMFDRIRIFTRGKEERHPNLIFSKSRDDVEISAVEAIKLARQAERKKLIRNPEEFRARIARLKEIISRNDNNQEQMEQLLAIEKEFEQAVLDSAAREER